MQDRVIAAELLLRAMRAGGVDYLFANSGTDFPPVIEAYARGGAGSNDYPAALVVPHEAVATGMAHGFYLMTGRPQAVMVHVNVGLANTVMAMINAAADNVPILMCSGRTPVTEAGRFGSRTRPIHWGQEMQDQAALVRETVKWDFELRYPEQAASLVGRALAIANSAPCGPVYLSLPREALADEVSLPPGAAGPMAPNLPGAPPQDAVEAAADLIAKSERPLIIAQRPAAPGSFSPLAEFAEKYAIPVCEYWATRSVLSTAHPMHAGHDVERWLGDTDLLLLLDTLVPWLPHLMDVPACPCIALGPDPLFSRFPVRGFPVEVNLNGDPAAAISALSEALDKRGAKATHHITARREWVERGRADIASDAGQRIARGRGAPMSPAWVSHCLSEIEDDTKVVFNELGCDLSVMRFEQRAGYFNAPLSGGLGWAMPAALGAKLANRDRLVIACVGDGSYMFANPVACHQTAAMHGLPILTVVFNNGRWQAVRWATLNMYPGGEAAKANVMPMTSLDPAPDYPAIAGAHGAYAERVSAAEELPAALSRAIAAIRDGRQALIEVVVSA